MSKTHGLTLKEAASKVSSADFIPSNATSLQALKTVDLEDIFKSMELMAEHVATLEHDNTVLLERLSTLETKSDMTLKAIEHPKESNEFKHMQELMDTMIRNQTKLAETTPNTNALMAEIRKLNSKIAELETLATTEQTKGGFWSRLFRN
ncbi:hypothetical protein ACQKMD_08490 [Viridibacillus sp. NPDC096237]|uniref:hypothetical protein n=1 Tax=Viridibacillus sp. NPDC096237 TaxID=3390721 RepID=UPI003CFE93C3